MKRLIALLILAISPNLYAQQQNQRASTPPEIEVERMRIQAEERHRQEMEQRDWETKIFPVKYADPGELRLVLSMFRAAIQPNAAMRVLSVRAPKEIMPAIEDAIKRFDVPSAQKSAELTIYVLVASNEPDNSRPVPQTLQPVINQLKNVFSYKGYQLADTLVARGGEDRYTKMMGVLPPFTNGGAGADYQFAAYFQVQNPDQKEPVLRLREMRFSAAVSVPAGNGNFRRADAAVATDVDIPRGQQVVVGKATVGESAIILVMTAKF